MSVIFLLIPLSIVIASFFLWAFIWAIRSGQYEDTTTPALRPLLEDRPRLTRDSEYLVPPTVNTKDKHEG